MVDLFAVHGAAAAARWAAALTGEFGTAAAVLAASPNRQHGMTDDARPVGLLQAVRQAMVETLRIEADSRPVLSGSQAVLDYLRADMAHLPRERARVLHLNARNRLLRDEVIADGTIDQAAIYPREVARRALELGSAAVVLVHNHPGGDPHPSRQDIALTREIIQALKPLGILVHDHWVIAATGQTSMRALGLL